MKKIVIIFYLSVLGLNLFAQCPQYPNPQWCLDNDKGNRYEGTKPTNVGGELKIVSFTLGDIPKYEFGKKQKLHVQFYSKTNYFLHAEQLDGEDGYWMEDKRHKGTSNWQTSTFGPWEVDMVLKPYQIEASNLGLLVEDKRNGNSVYFPAKILINMNKIQENSYVGIIRTNNDVENVTVKVYKGEKSSGKPIFTKTILSILSGANIKVKIPVDKFITEGYYYCEITFRKVADPKYDTISCLIYHKKYE